MGTTTVSLVHGGVSSSVDEEDKSRTETIFNEQILKETEVGSADESDQDEGPRAKRV